MTIAAGWADPNLRKDGASAIRIGHVNGVFRAKQRVEMCARHGYA